MKNQHKRALSIGLSGLMLLSCLTGCSHAGNTASSSSKAAAEADQIIQAAGSLLPSHSDTEGKTETVYVIADAEGDPARTIVSAWLKNPDGADTLEDTTDLADIVNTKGSETYTRTDGEHITWAANGSDIYYQGDSDRELPVTTAISYELDGKAVSPDELAGADGHLTITFEYTNNLSAEREIAGETVTLYQPFLVISGLMLDGDNASDITVTNGKVVNTGDRSIAVGMAMPGLRESLGLDTLEDRDGEPVELDIPESVVIEADVRDFELLTTVTIISNDLLAELDLENVDTIDELTDAMNELTDASAQLKDGAGELYDGVEELSGGTSDLTDGIDSLDSGAGELKDGAEELAAGASSLADGASAAETGAQQISKNMSALSEGLAGAQTGAESLETGLSQMQTSVADLPDGVDALYQGTVLISGALSEDIYGGLTSIESGADSLYAGLMTGESSIYGGAGAIVSGADGIAEGAERISSAALQVKTGIEAIPGTISASVGSAASALSAAEGALNGISTEGMTDEQIAGIRTAMAYIQGVESSLGSVSPDVSDAVSALDAIAAGADSISGGAQAISAGGSALQSGASQLAAGAGAISSGAQTLETGIDTIVSDENLGAVIAGLADLSENAGALVSGVDALASGASQLSEGIGSAADGASALSNGAADLYAGIEKVSAGASALSDGASQLGSGAGELKDGTAQLKDGTSALTDGAAALLDGAAQLRDGMVEFDEEGIQALSELVEDDAQGLIDRLKALQELAAEYTSFDGGDASVPGSVQFIIRTEAIEK